MQRNKKQCKSQQIEDLQVIQNSPQWSNLPQLCLSKIVSLLQLQSPFDKVRFQLVCKSWNDSYFSNFKYVLNRNLPLIIPQIPPIFVQDKGPIFIVGTCVYLVQPFDQPLTQPWLVSVEEVNLGKVKIHAPLTKKPIKDLPLNFTRGVDFSGFWVSVVYEGLKICFGNGGENVVRVLERKLWYSVGAKNKVILVPNDDNLGRNGRVAVVLMISECGTLMTFNLTSGKWMLLELGRLSHFDDIVSYMGFVFAIDRKGRLYPIAVDDIGKLRDVVVDGMCGALSTDNRKRLVVLGDDLYLINRVRKKFKVYKLNVGAGKWEEVQSLGGRIVLVTTSDVFCVNAGDFPRCRGDCILFSKQCFPSYMGNCSFEKEVFGVADKHLEVGVYYLGEDCFFPITNYPEFHDILWPFPSWIRSNSGHAARSSPVVGERRRKSPRLAALSSSREAPDMLIASSKAQNPQEDKAKRVSGSSGIPHQKNDESVQAVCYISQIPESGSHSKTPLTTCGEVPMRPVQIKADMDLILDDSSPEKNAENVDKFEGVNVSSCFVPILHEIQNEYGSIIQRNVDEVTGDVIFLKCCLETLAQAVQIVQSKSAKPLSNSDAIFLGACLPGLQHMPLNIAAVSWLAPLVKDALYSYHEQKENIAAQSLSISPLSDIKRASL